MVVERRKQIHFLSILFDISKRMLEVILEYGHLKSDRKKVRVCDILL